MLIRITTDKYQPQRIHYNVNMAFCSNNTNLCIVTGSLGGVQFLYCFLSTCTSTVQRYVYNTSGTNQITKSTMIPIRLMCITSRKNGQKAGEARKYIPSWSCPQCQKSTGPTNLEKTIEIFRNKS